MALNNLIIEKEGHIATVIFSRPGKLNALNMDLMNEIVHAAESFKEDVETRVVIFTGAGGNFTAGLDLSDETFIQRMENDSVLMKRRFMKLGPRMVRAIYSMDQITIAAVNGAATGGGACIAAACDLRIGADGCRIGYPEVGLGMNLSWVALPMCVHLIGPAKAKRMVILAETQDAGTMLEWGFLDAVVPEEQLMETAKEMARAFAGKPPIAVQMVKQSINAITSALDQAVMHMDGDQFLLASKTDDFMEGIAAFIEKRKPEFKGN